MKYYVYISDAKVDMLLPQIPESSKSKVATELKIDLKILSVSRKTESLPQNDRITRVRAVDEYIRQEGIVGSIDSPREYFAATLKLFWGSFDGAVMFMGETPSTAVVIGGSEAHLLSAKSESLSTPVGVSNLPGILWRLGVFDEGPIIDHAFEDDERDPDFERADALSLVCKLGQTSSRRPTQVMEFVAKRLMVGQSEKQAVIGSPLYVALAE